MIGWCRIRPIFGSLIDAKEIGHAFGKGCSYRQPTRQYLRASIPLALNAAVQDGRIQPGHIIAFEAIGGGLTWGASLARFGRP